MGLHEKGNEVTATVLASKELAVLILVGSSVAVMASPASASVKHEQRKATYIGLTASSARGPQATASLDFSLSSSGPYSLELVATTSPRQTVALTWTITCIDENGNSTSHSAGNSFTSPVHAYFAATVPYLDNYFSDFTPSCEIEGTGTINQGSIELTLEQRR